MDWQIVGAIADLIGAVGVIATVLFLSIQIRQNTKAMKTNAEQSIATSLSDMFDLSAGTDIPHIFVRAATNPEELTEEEASKFGFFISSFLKKLEQAHIHWRSGDLSDATWRAVDAAVKAQFQSEGIRQYWKSRKSVYGVEFQNYIDAIDLEEEFSRDSRRTVEEIRQGRTN